MNQLYENKMIAQEMITECVARDNAMRKRPMRIDPKTVILVKEDRCNDKYRRRYINKLRMAQYIELTNEE